MARVLTDRGGSRAYGVEYVDTATLQSHELHARVIVYALPRSRRRASCSIQSPGFIPMASEIPAACSVAI